MTKHNFLKEIVWSFHLILKSFQYFFMYLSQVCIEDKRYICLDNIHKLYVCMYTGFVYLIYIVCKALYLCVPEIVKNDSMFYNDHGILSSIVSPQVSTSPVFT